MKSPRKTFAALYAECMDIYWTTLTGRPTAAPAAPAEEVTRKAAQVAADQEWEDEGGSIKPAKKPAAQPSPKIPH